MQLPFNKAIENVGLVRECWPQHLLMEIAKMKNYNETEK